MTTLKLLYLITFVLGFAGCLYAIISILLRTIKKEISGLKDVLEKDISRMEADILNQLGKKA